MEQPDTLQSFSMLASLLKCNLVTVLRIRRINLRLGRPVSDNESHLCY